MKFTFRVCPLLICLMTLVGCNTSVTEPAKETKKDSGTSLDAKIRRFAPTEITADVSQLSAGDRQALTKIIEAAKLLDPLFLRQVWSGNEALRNKLAADTTAEGRANHITSALMPAPGPASTKTSHSSMVCRTKSRRTRITTRTT